MLMRMGSYRIPVAGFLWIDPATLKLESSHV